MKNDRKTEIRNHLFEHGLTDVHTLAGAVGASQATMRRDLGKLERDGQIERVRGGARIAQSASVEIGFGAREAEMLAEKRQIGKTAYELIRSNSTILLDAGTTVLQLARRIKLEPIPLTIFTNGIVVAQELVNVAGVTVCLLGGRLRSANMSIIGPLAESMLEHLWFDQLFLGSSAIDAQGLVSSFDSDEASLNACMTTRARQTCLLADHSKFLRRATYTAFKLGQDDEVITDRWPDAELAGVLADRGVKVTLPRRDDADG